MVEKAESRFSFGVIALLVFIFAIIIQITFVLLRIFHVIDWSAVWILMPMIVIGGLLLLLVGFLIFYVLLTKPGKADREEDM
jgi:ABC-type Fe3+-siderophore transport system permease subunit